MESTQVVSRNKEKAMPPSSVYIGRTTERRTRRTGAVWFWAFAVAFVLATAFVLVAM